jgi:hypothetical protein
MKSWWQKWTVDKPAAFGDWLWLVFVVQLANLLNRLTVRRVIEVIAITLLTIMFVQTLPLDLAILFAGDTLLYLELVTLASLVATTVRISRTLSHAMLSVKNGLCAVVALIPRLIRHVRMPRSKKPAVRRKGPSDDRPALGWGDLSFA